MSRGIRVEETRLARALLLSWRSRALVPALSTTELMLQRLCSNPTFLLAARHISYKHRFRFLDMPERKNNPKQRGHPQDTPQVRLSKSLSWLLRHGANKSGLQMRPDGYARVSDVVSKSEYPLRQVVTRPLACQ